MQPARVVEPRGEGRHVGARRRSGHLAARDLFGSLLCKQELRWIRILVSRLYRHVIDQQHGPNVEVLAKHEQILPAYFHVEQDRAIWSHTRIDLRNQDVAAKAQTTLIIPPPALCTDNGAMIAWAGAERLAIGISDTMDTPPRARWLLDENATAPAGYANTRAGF